MTLQSNCSFSASSLLLGVCLRTKQWSCLRVSAILFWLCVFRIRIRNKNILSIIPWCSWLHQLGRGMRMPSVSYKRCHTEVTFRKSPQWARYMLILMGQQFTIYILFINSTQYIPSRIRSSKGTLFEGHRHACGGMCCCQYDSGQRNSERVGHWLIQI